MAALARGRLRGSSAAPLVGERVETLVSDEGVVIEQILSGSLAAPAEFRQDHDEWVVVLGGSAVVDVGGERVELCDGDWLVVPRDVVHRVLDTTPGTSWLAVHLPPGSPGSHHGGTGTPRNDA